MSKKFIVGVLGNKLKVDSYVANLAGHISNYVTIETLGVDGKKTYIRLEKDEATNLVKQLNNSLENLL